MKRRKPVKIRPGVTATLTVEGAGYSVCVLVNGHDVGVRNAPAESRQLFSKSHPLSSKVRSEFRKNLVVLKDGPNQLVINFKKTGEATEPLKVQVFTDGPAPLFTLASSELAHGKVNRTVNLSGRSAMSMTDADVRT